MNVRIWLYAALAVLLFAAVNTASASTATTAATVKAIFVHSGNSGIPAGVLIRTSQENPNGCPSGWWYSIAASHPLYDQLVAVVLSAQAQGLAISPYVTGCSGQYPAVTHIAVTIP